MDLALVLSNIERLAIHARKVSLTLGTSRCHRAMPAPFVIGPRIQHLAERRRRVLHRDLKSSALTSACLTL